MLRGRQEPRLTVLSVVSVSTEDAEKLGKRQKRTAKAGQGLQKTPNGGREV